MSRKGPCTPSARHRCAPPHPTTLLWYQPLPLPLAFTGVLAGSFETTRFKSKVKPAKLTDVHLLGLGEGSAAAEAVKAGAAVAAGNFLTRWEGLGGRRTMLQACVCGGGDFAGNLWSCLHGALGSVLCLVIAICQGRVGISAKGSANLLSRITPLPVCLQVFG
jgi:hypothetical protein